MYMSYVCHLSCHMSLQCAMCNDPGIMNQSKSNSSRVVGSSRVVVVVCPRWGLQVTVTADWNYES